MKNVQIPELNNMEELKLFVENNKELFDSFKEVKQITNNLEQIFKNHDINLLTKRTYMWLNLHCGFIAHYNIDGFKQVYENLSDLIYHFEHSYTEKSRFMYINNKNTYLYDNNTDTMHKALCMIKTMYLFDLYRKEIQQFFTNLEQENGKRQAIEIFKNLGYQVREENEQIIFYKEK